MADILNPSTPAPLPLNVLTLAQKQAQYAKQEQIAAQIFYNQMLAYYNTRMTKFWQNPDPTLTPTVLAAALGPMGQSAVTKLAILRDALNAMMPVTVPPQTPLPTTLPQAITFDADGNIILG